MSACFVHRVRMVLLHTENRDISSPLSISGLIISGSQISSGSHSSEKRSSGSRYWMQELILC